MKVPRGSFFVKRKVTNDMVKGLLRTLKAHKIQPTITNSRSVPPIKLGSSMKSIAELTTKHLEKHVSTVEELEAKIDDALEMLVDNGYIRRLVVTVEAPGISDATLSLVASKYASGGWRAAFGKEYNGTVNLFHVWHPDVPTTGFGSGMPWEGKPSEWAREIMERQQEVCRQNRILLGLEQAPTDQSKPTKSIDA